MAAKNLVGGHLENYFFWIDKPADFLGCLLPNGHIANEFAQEYLLDGPAEIVDGFVQVPVAS